MNGHAERLVEAKRVVGSVLSVQYAAAGGAHYVTNMSRLIVEALDDAHLFDAPSELVEIAGLLTDPDPCSFDHEGYCQAHSWLSSGECPHARAKRFLGIDNGG